MRPARIDPVKAADEGANLLDIENPGWWRLINTKTLAMGTCTTCILGQLYKHFDNGMDSLRLQMAPPDAAAKLGFDIGSYERLEDYTPLKKAWIDEIQKRRQNEEAGT